MITLKQKEDFFDQLSELDERAMQELMLYARELARNKDRLFSGISRKQALEEIRQALKQPEKTFSSIG